MPKCMNYQGVIGRLVKAARAKTSWNCTAYNIWFNQQVSLLLFSLAVWIFAYKNLFKLFSLLESLFLFSLCFCKKKNLLLYEKIGIVCLFFLVGKWQCFVLAFVFKWRYMLYLFGTYIFIYMCLLSSFRSKEDVDM